MVRWILVNPVSLSLSLSLSLSNNGMVSRARWAVCRALLLENVPCLKCAVSSIATLRHNGTPVIVAINFYTGFWKWIVVQPRIHWRKRHLEWHHNYVMSSFDDAVIMPWAAQPGGTMCPHFWDQRGTGGTGGGPMKMIFAFMFINAKTRQQISIYSIGPYWYLLACTPHLEKWGTIFFSLAPLANPFCTPP